MPQNLLATCAITFALIGCNRATTQPLNSDMTFHDAVRSTKDLPVEDSVAAVTRSLASRSILVATEGAETAWRTSVDNEGGIWAHFYTDETELLNAIPEGATYAEMKFADAFSVIDTNSQFRGIQMNSASDAFYPIPRELFKQVNRELQP